MPRKRWGEDPCFIAFVAKLATPTEVLAGGKGTCSAPCTCLLPLLLLRQFSSHLCSLPPHILQDHEIYWEFGQASPLPSPAGAIRPIPGQCMSHHTAPKIVCDGPNHWTSEPVTIFLPTFHLKPADGGLINHNQCSILIQSDFPQICCNVQRFCDNCHRFLSRLSKRISRR